MRPLAYVTNSLDRCANQRTDADWLARQIGDPRARLVRINGDRTTIEGGRLATGTPAACSDPILLGVDGDGVPWFAAASTAEENLRDLRSIAMEQLLPEDQIGLLAQARSLVHWHERRSFCSNCGTRMASADAGYRRHCGSCGMDHFPRTDPVIIIVARHRGRVLLGRQRSWTPGMFSALAGFMEPGETIEAAARREVQEESGIAIGEVTYVTSQPWPFPASLMIGLIGEALTDDIRVDEKELEVARWFPFAEAQAMVDRTHPDGLWAANPMAIAHQLVRTAIQSD